MLKTDLDTLLLLISLDILSNFISRIAANSLMFSRLCNNLQNLQEASCPMILRLTVKYKKVQTSTTTSSQHDNSL